MLTHLADRCVTFRRFPNGVDGKSFFEKRCPSHRPEWVRRRRSGPRRPQRRDRATACSTSVAALVWAANLAALELHTPMARADDIESPTMVVFDLDPGAPAGMAECAEVALGIRDVAGRARPRAVREDSGSKGLQLYVPLNTPRTHDHAASFALAVAQVLEKHHPTGASRRPWPRPRARARSSSTGARTPATRRRSAPTRCGPGPTRRCRRRSPGTRWAAADGGRCPSRPPRCSTASPSTATCSPPPHPAPGAAGTGTRRELSAAAQVSAAARAAQGAQRSRP